MTNNAFDSCFNTTPAEKALFQELQQGFHHRPLTNDDYIKMTQCGAGSGPDLEGKGILPSFKIDDLNKFSPLALVENDDKTVAQFIKGFIENKPDVLAKAAALLKDGDYPLGEIISGLEKSGLLHVDKEHEQLINGFQTLSKHGNHFEITRKDEAIETVGGHEISVGKDIQFDVVSGDNPSIKHIHGLQTTGFFTGVNIEEVDASKNDHGSYNYKIHHGGARILFGGGSGDIEIKT